MLANAIILPYTGTKCHRILVLYLTQNQKTTPPKAYTFGGVVWVLGNFLLNCLLGCHELVEDFF
ncbi:MAG: hypothetical protein RR705_10890, partial [Lachnospiraceae bacterium]